jgi:hypothetical protein
MDEIHIKKYELEDLLSKRNENLRCVSRRKFVLAFILIGIILINIIPSSRPQITITAYAAENEVMLSNKFAEFDLSAQPLDGGLYDDKNAYMNYNIYFKCEGENIKSITYTCTDKAVTLNNRRSASAYYVQNMTMTVDEYKENNQYEDLIYSYYTTKLNLARIVRLIGNSYSVPYENQSDIQYGLILAATYEKVNNYYNYYINDTIIKVDILFNDGSEQHKKILIKSDGNASNSIKIRIL